jgi:hypothetical protein
MTRQASKGRKGDGPGAVLEDAALHLADSATCQEVQERATHACLGSLLSQKNRAYLIALFPQPSGLLLQIVGSFLRRTAHGCSLVQLFNRCEALIQPWEKAP